jgi:hypothetical protein
VIEAVADLFVERVPRAAMRANLLPASSLLVVDACGKPRRLVKLTRLVEASGPIRASYVTLELVEDVPELATYESVWLVFDSASDANYCGLYLRELAERFRGARVATVGVGDVESCDVALSEAMAGVAPPWRRGRELARGAALLHDRLLGST